MATYFRLGKDIRNSLEAGTLDYGKIKKDLDAVKSTFVTDLIKAMKDNGDVRIDEINIGMSKDSMKTIVKDLMNTSYMSRIQKGDDYFYVLNLSLDYDRAIKIVMEYIHNVNFKCFERHIADEFVRIYNTDAIIYCIGEVKAMNSGRIKGNEISAVYTLLEELGKKGLRGNDFRGMLKEEQPEPIPKPTVYSSYEKARNMKKSKSNFEERVYTKEEYDEMFEFNPKRPLTENELIELNEKYTKAMNKIKLTESIANEDKKEKEKKRNKAIFELGLEIETTITIADDDDIMRALPKVTPQIYMEIYERLHINEQRVYELMLSYIRANELTIVNQAIVEQLEAEIINAFACNR